MDSRTQAVAITAMIQQAAQSGVPVIIPGAWHAHRPTPRLATPELARPIDRAVDDPDRLQSEREGGGAPRERAVGRRRTLLDRLWRLLLHPTDSSTDRRGGIQA